MLVKGAPGRRRSIIRTNIGILSIRTLGINFSEILSKISTFSFKKMHLKMSSGEWRSFLPQCDICHLPLLYAISHYAVECLLNKSLQSRHNRRDSGSNHQPHDSLLNRLFRCRSKKTSKHRVTGLCAGTSPGTGEIPAQTASYAENVSVWWRHHVVALQDKHFFKCN